MGRYGEVAIRAVGLMLWEPATSPSEAWSSAAVRVFPDRPSSQSKGCPKGAFLGLCEEGVVAGVSPGVYTRSKLNKGYALRALAALRQSPRLGGDQRRLWQIATGDNDVTPNSQMDVLTALWTARLVR